MLETYDTIARECTGEVVEKKSRFIAYLAPVKTIEEAEAFIERIRKENYDARHNCIAYTIGMDQPTNRCSDDGEPSGTAGKPMLDILLGEGLCNVVAVVTRYFGGTLLGTGGLVRAYSQAMKEAIQVCEKETYHFGQRIKMTCDYTAVGKIQYLFEQNHISQIEANYLENVEFVLMIPVDKVENFIKQMTELTSGRAKIEKGDTCYYTIKSGTVISDVR